MPILMVERGNDKGLTLKVEPGKTYVVGRDNPQAAIALNDPMASRAHFQISGNNGSFKVKDMKSRNGTTLNDEKLAPDAEMDLKVGDKIQVGETIFSLLSDEKEETAAGGLVGKTIGGYILQERVGRGGMGTVYKAEQISLKRVVALKVLSAKLLSDPVFVDRFVQEARAAGALNHPNIVQVFDVGSDRGVYYFSMEFMDHGSVGDIVSKEGPVPWARALEMLTDSAKGLIFAEKHGVVHRDIKPDNLMLTSEGTVKIGDLGLAKKAADLAGEGGQIFGTPHFIAPEQAQGKSIDHRADIYALGASFYRVLSGKTPFSGENVKEILIKQVQEQPVPLKKLVSDIPDELGAVISKMMQKKPDDRYRSAQGLFEDLEVIRVRYHLEAHGERESARRSKFLAIGAVVVALGLGGVAYHFATLPPPPPKEGETIYIDKSNGNTGPVVDPAELRAKDAQQAFNDVRELKFKLVTKLKGLGPADTWQEHEGEWDALAKKFEAVSSKFSDTPAGKSATKEARDILAEIAGAKKAHEEAKSHARKQWTDLMESADRHVADGQPAKAVAELLEKSAALVASSKAFLDADADKSARAKADAIADAAIAAVDALRKKVEEAAPRFPGKDYREAREALLPVLAGLKPATATADQASERMRKAESDTRTALRAARTAATEATLTALDSDTEDYFKTYMAIRRWGPPGGVAPDKESPFFEYRFDECIAQWNELLGRMNTTEFKARVKAKIAQYGRCKRLFETIAAVVKSRALKEPKFPKTVRKGATVLLDTKPELLAGATPEGVNVLVVVGGNNQKVFLPFREMTPQEIHQFFLKGGVQPAPSTPQPLSLPLTPEDRLNLAVFLAEAGAGDIAYAELAVIAGGANPVVVDAGVEAWVKDECNIFFEYTMEGGILRSFNDYVKMRADANSKPAEIEAKRRAIEERIREFHAADRAVGTDFFVLQFSTGGASGPVPRQLLPAAAVRQILRTLGTGVEPGTPEKGEDEKPPDEKPQDGKPADAAPKEEPPVEPKEDGKEAPPTEPGDPKEKTR